jgi:putative hydrolase of the HAD superfamily
MGGIQFLGFLRDLCAHFAPLAVKSFTIIPHSALKRREDALAKITALFWDVGGVLLSNAWDHTQRKQALDHFGLDESEFDDRHDMVVSSFERGKINLQEYLERTVFYRPRPFTLDDFKSYMLPLSQPNPAVLEFARSLANSGHYLMSTINNESTDLNLHRIRTFGLHQIFDLFVSSCFVGFRKPEKPIYRMALEITQRPPEQCCFIDDRALNLECAAKLGMHVIQMQNADQLRRDLQTLGVAA